MSFTFFAHGRTLVPGLTICLIVAASARFLSEHYDAPQMLFALLLGLSLNFLLEGDKAAPGIMFSSQSVLKCGVALLGFRITMSDVSALGWPLMSVTVLTVSMTIAVGVAISFLFKRHLQFGLLTGGAVAICGASAALAISAVLPNSTTRERDTAFTVVSVTALSTFAMILYPIAAQLFDFSDRQAGILLGLTIHDVAQVVGAGYSMSEETGNIATVVKLFRVAMLVPVVMAMSIAFGRAKKQKRAVAMPPFLYGFCIAAALNSFGVLPATVTETFVALSNWLLVVGIVGIGIKTSLKSLMEVGSTALLIVSLETGFLFALVSLGLFWVQP